MIAQTADRFEGEGFLDPAVICNAAHSDAVASEVSGKGAILLEPVGRNTAPAAAIAALHGQDVGAELVLLSPADHHVRNPDAFRDAARAASAAAREGYIVTFGITPDRPETGYGYIRMGDPVSGEVRRVDAFVEKPDLETAKSYLSAGGYAWNGGLFLFAPSLMLAEMEAFAPEMLSAARAAYEQAKTSGREIALDRDAFAASPSESIDYAVMEKTTHAACLSVDMGWSDIGSFMSLLDASERDNEGNRLPTTAMAVNAQDNLVMTDGPQVSLVGVSGVGVIVRGNEVLVVNLDHSQSVKQLVDGLKASGEMRRL